MREKMHKNLMRPRLTKLNKYPVKLFYVFKTWHWHNSHTYGPFFSYSAINSANVMHPFNILI